MDDQAPISKEEMVGLFGHTMPPEVATLLFESDPARTLGSVRADVRALGRKVQAERLKGEERVAMENKYTGLLFAVREAVKAGDAEKAREASDAAFAFETKHPRIVEAYERRLGVRK